ncbi:MAG: hypothetical protein HOQ22_08055 [Nocardioidaceae bacterium]|nr:hypothetical protein [Nocardioidaceae bacterium]NUS50976.1 hypothetical protein [Nocardioidaceae bacterium]
MKGSPPAAVTATGPAPCRYSRGTASRYVDLRSDDETPGLTVTMARHRDTAWITIAGQADLETEVQASE